MQTPRTIRNRKTATFSPKSEFKDVSELVRPRHGQITEVLIAWKERVISTSHFSGLGPVTFGSRPDCDVRLPMAISQIRHMTLLERRRDQTHIFLPAGFAVEVSENDKVKTMDPLKEEALFSSDKTKAMFTLQQGQMLRIRLGHDISLLIRYVEAASAKPRVSPILIGAGEALSAVSALIILFGLHFLVRKSESMKPEPSPVEPLSMVAQLEIQPPLARPHTLPETSQKESEPVSQAASPVLTNPPQGAVGEAAVPSRTKKQKTPSAPRAQLKRPVTFSILGQQTETSASTALVESATRSNGSSAQGSESLPGGRQFLDTGDSRSNNAIGIGRDVGDTFKPGARNKGPSRVGGLGDIQRAGVIAPTSQPVLLSGHIDRAAVRRVIEQNLKVIRSCYTRALNKSPDLSGKLVIGWEVEAAGHVAATRTVTNELRSAEVASCVQRHLSTWRFPEPPRNESYRVEFPFVFSSQ